jgi:hypothetical protein
MATQTSGLESAMTSGALEMPPDANVEQTGGNTQPEKDGKRAPERSAEAAPAQRTSPEDAQAQPADAGENVEGASEQAGQEAVADWVPDQVADTYEDTVFSKAAEEAGIDPALLSNPLIKKALKAEIDAKIAEKAGASVEDDFLGLSEELADGDEVVDEDGAQEAEEAPAPRTPTPADILEASSRFATEALQYDPELSLPLLDRFADAMDAFYNTRGEAVDGEGNTVKGQAAATPEQRKAAAVKLGQSLNQLMFLGLREIGPHMRNYLVRPVIETERRQFAVMTAARRELAKNPLYADIEKMTGRGGALDRIAYKFPELLNKQFTGRDGKKLGAVANTVEMLKVAHRLWRGGNQKPAPELVRSGMDAGKLHEQKMQNRKDLGNLGQGRTTGKVPTRGGAGPQDSKEFMDRHIAAHAADDPLANFSGRNRK